MDRAIQGIAGETRVTVEGALSKTPARPGCANWAGRRNEPYCSFIHTLEDDTVVLAGRWENVPGTRIELNSSGWWT